MNNNLKLDLMKAIEQAKSAYVEFSEITFNDKYTAYNQNLAQAFIGFVHAFPDELELIELNIVCKL